VRLGRPAEATLEFADSEFDYGLAYGHRPHVSQDDLLVSLEKVRSALRGLGSGEAGIKEES